MTVSHSSGPQVPYDVVIIGGGVVGCAVARRFTLGGARVCLLEKEPDILEGSASKGNSAILHTGFDAPEGSLEQRCVQAGYQEYLQIRHTLNLPLLETGAVMAAWTEEEAALLPGLVDRAHRNGVTDVELITAAELAEREPNLAEGALAGLIVPGEHVIDPWSAPLAYLSQAVANGAVAITGAEVIGAKEAADGWELATKRGVIRGRVVINCAGLYGDMVEALAGLNSFRIQPRRGQFLVFDKSASQLVRSIVLPVPTERTKGVLVVPTVFGNLLVGPTAEDVEERSHPPVEHAVLEWLRQQAEARVPAIGSHPIVAVFAGLRPATDSRDYRISFHPHRSWITIGGIRSTGLTGSLGIARYVFEEFEKLFDLELTPLSDPVATPVPNLAEHLPRDYQQPGCGPIVCHCELVTRREIEAALTGPLPAATLGGLKRRTRAMMGRCQGFFCAAEVTDLAHRHLAEPLVVGKIG